ncbi:hypothetical protein FisN_19Lh283 [Fistulifera solaris]|uniref:RING-type domain-containing protein n=1 Tax=Fistulifera solaris TaxID=1519565 RepID=A0A1Z5K8D3_FISSO|nr:hypothetical protein FisN_19Lh283 [Fistulifera solaris]|eukprot:GAX22218.1 hypothetical protein FisN_19Lh283 [Fistulifera solaris]
MGNKASQESGRIGGRLRQSNGLGLTRLELDERCRPSGLYPSCHWEDKVIRRLIGDGKLAARQKGTERRTKESDHECPICFLNYGQVNVTKCCQAVLCTECYLQVHPQREKSVCPFCNNPKLVVSIKQGLTHDELQQRAVEEERIRIRNDPERAIENQQPPEGYEPPHDENCPQPLAEETLSASSAHSTSDAYISGMTSSGHSSTSVPTNIFGASLEQDSRFLLMKARSESISSEGRESPPLEALALSASERRQLEAEMQAQNKHPLALRLRMEEEERWLQNELEHHRNSLMNRNNTNENTRVLRLGGGSARRDWNRILSALDQDRNGSDVATLLEATMSLSMEERQSLGLLSTSSDLFMTGLTEEEQLAMAIEASLQASATEQLDSHSAEDGGEGTGNLNEEAPRDA